jgi:glutamate dehydrogenase (NAD(P)+)
VAGIKIVGISDVSGFIYNKDGLNIPRLMLDMRGKAKLSDLPKSEKVDNKTIPDSHSSYNILDKDDIFEVDSDVFIPVAMSGVINDKTAPKLLEHGIKIIVEAANIPTTSTADEYLNKNGVWIILTSWPMLAVL